MTTASLLHTINDHTGDINCVVFGVDTIATASTDKTIRLWQLSSDDGDVTEVACSPLCAHTYSVTCCDVAQMDTPSGRLLASCSIDGRCIVWNINSGRIVSALQHLSGCSLRVCRISPDASLLVTGGNDELLCLWDLSSGKLLRSMEGHDAAVVACCFSPDGSCIVSGSPAGDLRVWDAMYGHGKCLHFEADAHDLGVTCCAFSPNVSKVEEWQGENMFLLASGGFDNKVTLWQLISEPVTLFRQWRTLEGHMAPIMTCCFSPSGHLLASGGADKTIRLWNPATEHLEHIIEGHTRYVATCAFSHDGHLLASGSSDRLVKVWKINSNPHDTGQGSGATASLDITDTIDQPDRWSVAEVSSWLIELGMSRYVDKFRSNAINGTELLTLTSSDLENSLHIEILGHRNVILRAIANLHTQQQILSKTINGSSMPDEYLCPITREIMKDPVIASDGYSYERNAIEAWMRKGNVRSPMTNALLDSAMLLPNRNIKMLIQRYLDQR